MRLLSSSAPILLLACLATAAPPMRAALNSMTLGGWMRASGKDSAQARVIEEKRRHLRYYAGLGFTHVCYPPDYALLDGLTREKGEWIYRPERVGGGPDSSFRAFQAEADRLGLQVIPFLPSLSHIDPFTIWVDSTLSEFPSWAAFDSFCVAKGLPRDRNLNHVASPVDNPAADQIYRALLRFVKSSWQPSALAGKGPSYILIGHDELGHDSVSFIKAGKTRPRKESASQLVAMEIRRRAAQIDSVLGPATEILLFGDSFLPTDLGERYGLTGDGKTGAGGVLWDLARDPGLRDRLVVIPWNYILSDGQTHYWSRLKYDRSRQLAYLDTLGFRYLLGVGEHGGMGGTAQNPFAPPFGLGDPVGACRHLFEWIESAQHRPHRMAGYLHATFEKFDLCTPDRVCVGFTAPLLAYLAWAPGSPYAARPALLRGKAFDPNLMRDVDYVRSRKDLAWKAGTHYQVPAQGKPASPAKAALPAKAPGIP